MHTCIHAYIHALRQGAPAAAPSRQPAITVDSNELNSDEKPRPAAQTPTHTATKTLQKTLYTIL